MSEIKLKPCPFCGGEAFCYVSGRIEPEMPDMFWVRCKNCDVVTKSYTTREKAIKKWNTRALGWIPVEERLPEDERANYEVTFINECGYEEHGFAQWYDGEFHIPAVVIAWREHLEPYRPEPLETRKELEEDSKGEKDE